VITLIVLFVLADAGCDRVYVHQVGSDQEAFMRLYEREVLSAALR
jgi:hypothetical protein